MAINILDSFIANRISAGEVVEKPASIVKELLDNAVDAGATQIDIDILNGGIDLISIRDNGCGIEPDDIKKAFLPHATSKISKVEDLDNISTLGFRGEALASISSVAQVTMITKTQNIDYASSISVNGGEFGSVLPTSSSNGTLIEVRNLFYNTPARRKFLRRPKTEENDITNYIGRYILAHPNIRIRYTANNKIVFDNKGGDLLNAISCVYGVDITQHLEQIEEKQGEITISGYIGKVSYTKPNTSYQTLILNGRYVIDETISKAVYSAYEEFLMSRQFPFFVINLTMPYSNVDVNVHPSKLNVKFARPSEMYDLFYRAVRRTIYNSINPVKEPELSTPTQTYVVEPKTHKEQVNINFKEDIFKPDESLINQVDELETQLNKLNDFNRAITPASEEVEIVPVNPIFRDEKVETSVRFEQFVPQRNASIFDTELKSTEEHPSYQSINNFSDYKVIGELFNEFLILEKDDVMLMVDFHAGHERLLYDKFVEEVKSKNIDVQTLLVPYYHTLNVQEMEYIIAISDKLKQFGFEIEEFGPNEIRVNSVPVMLSDINLKTFVDDLLHDMNVQNPKIDNELDRRLAQKACKSAVKAGMTLSDLQIGQLLKNLDINKPVLLCPHGRPIVTVVKRSQIERWFKRIV